MPRIKLYDPYYLIDPTNPHNPAPVLTRTAGGKFNGYSQLSAMTDNDFPIDSKYWAGYAKGEMDRIKNLAGWDVLDEIFPKRTIRDISWRMIWEMLYAGSEAIVDEGKNPVAAAHAYLASKQYEIARIKLGRDLAESDEPNKILSEFFTNNWDLIPEVEF